MNVSNDRKELRTIVDRSAQEPSLEKIADTLVFFVIPVHKTGDDTLKDPAHRHLAGLYKQMNMIRHQAVSNQLKAANRLILAKNCQKLSIIIGIFKYSLLVVAAINNMINT